MLGKKETYYDKLTKNAKQHFSDLTLNGRCAFNILADSYYNKNFNHSYSYITERMQVQYFALNTNLSLLQSKGKNGWWQNEAYEPSSVGKNVEPIINDKDDMGNLIYEKSEKQFSDFINKMVGDVKSGRGDLISYQEFIRRVR